MSHLEREYRGMRAECPSTTRLIYSVGYVKWLEGKVEKLTTDNKRIKQRLKPHAKRTS
jgi:hypothetical protein